MNNANHIQLIDYLSLKTEIKKVVYGANCLVKQHWQLSVDLLKLEALLNNALVRAVWLYLCSNMCHVLHCQVLLLSLDSSVLNTQKYKCMSLFFQTLKTLFNIVEDQ